MSLSAATRLGPYEITAPLGAGGMGEVYRAHDTRIGREVAVKVLPASYSSDPDRLRRFEQEARAAGALNHPNVLTLHDVGRHDGTPYIVSELLEGETLRQRLSRGPLGVGKALDYAVQVARGLAAAHDKGIVHRDLKPENLFVTRDERLKILDFGIAKLTEPGTDEGISDAPTAEATKVGTVLGTAGYMSPEQVGGRPADHRSDLFSFGAILYEMLTGQRAFRGESKVETMHAVLTGEPPPIAEANPRVPSLLERIVRRCLEKSPENRFQSARDLAFALEGTEGLARAPAPQGRHGVTCAAALAGIAAALLLGIALGRLVRMRETVPVARRVRFEIPVTDRTIISFSLSPDGQALAFVTENEALPASRELWVHSLDSGQTQRLVSGGAFGLPFWSPDGRSIAFYADRKLKRIDRSAGSVQTVTDAPASSGGLGGGAWNADDVVVFESLGLLMRVSSSGGAARPLTALDASRREIGHHFPRFLPDGRHFLYLRASAVTNSSGIYIGSLDKKPEEQDSTRLLATRTNAVYAPSANYPRTGHLLFLRKGTLMAQGFDAVRLQVTGEAVPVAEDVGEVDVPSARFGYFSVSETGVLAYRSSEGFLGTPVWVDRNGRELAPVVQAPLDRPTQLQLSPDGRRLALVVAGDLWVYDLGGRPPIKLTFDGANDEPLWTPDGKRLVYATTTPPLRLLSVPADLGGGAPETVSPAGHYHPKGWSSDGRDMLAVLNSYTPTSWDILSLPAGGKGEPWPVVRTSAQEGFGGAALSSDGGWLAYTSNVTGSQEIWAQPYPGPGTPVRVSGNGGSDPVWARNGRELYYVEKSPCFGEPCRSTAKLMSVTVERGSGFNFKPPLALFESQYRLGGDRRYDVAPDGRFIMIKEALPRPASRPISVVLNWTAGR